MTGPEFVFHFMNDPLQFDNFLDLSFLLLISPICSEWPFHISGVEFEEYNAGSC